MNPFTSTRHLAAILSALTGIFFFLISVGTVHAQAPTVNGYFFCDGDNNRYQLLQESTNARGKIYYYLDQTTNELYIAMVIDPDVNDNVYGSLSLDQNYLDSVGWDGSGGAQSQGAKHTLNALIGSDRADFSLQCISQTYSWSQDLLYTNGTIQNNDPRTVTWLSDPDGPEGGINGTTPPPGMISASSAATSINNTTWDLTLGGTRTSASEWKSPPVSNPGGSLIWPECNSTYSWEFALVYEWKVDLDDCNCDPDAFVFVDPSEGHNSPVKDGGGDGVFFDPVTLRDYGDLPDTYGTLDASSGAYHTLTPNGPKLGSVVDSDTDGDPTALANGDDLNDGTDDEDGVNVPNVVEPGEVVTLTIIGTPGAYVEGFVDLNEDGDMLDGNENIVDNQQIPAGGSLMVTLQALPANFVPGDLVYVRFRIKSSPDQLGPTGAADDGEVEDYRALVVQVCPTKPNDPTANASPFCNDDLSANNPITASVTVNNTNGSPNGGDVYQVKWFSDAGATNELQDGVDGITLSGTYLENIQIASTSSLYPGNNSSLTLYALVENTAEADLCQSDLIAVLLNNESPNPAISGTSTVCANQTGVSYSVASGFDSYTWTVSGDATFTGQGTNAISVDWGSAGNRLVSVVVNELVGSTTCVGNASFPVLVKAPTIAVGSAAACVGDDQAVLNYIASGDAPLTFTVDYDNGAFTDMNTPVSLSAGAGTLTLTGIPTNLVAGDVNTGTITIIDTDGCTSSATFSITSVGDPVLGQLSPSVPVGCDGLAPEVLLTYPVNDGVYEITYNVVDNVPNTVEGPNTVTVVISGGSASFDLQNNLNTAGSPYTLEVTQMKVAGSSAGNCESTGSRTATITVNTTPTANPDASLDLCKSSSITVAGNPTGGQPPYGNFNWNILSSPQNTGELFLPDEEIVIFNSENVEGAVDLEFTFTDANGCPGSGTTSLTITNFVAPSAPTADDVVACPNGSTEITFSGAMGQTINNAATWTFTSGVTGTGTPDVITTATAKAGSGLTDVNTGNAPNSGAGDCLDAYYATSWTTAGTRDPNDYLEFEVSAQLGLSINEITFFINGVELSSGNQSLRPGPANWELVHVGPDTVLFSGSGSVPNGSCTQQTVSGFTEIELLSAQNAVFRLYGFGGANGYMEVDDFTVSIETNPVFRIYDMLPFQMSNEVTGSPFTPIQPFNTYDPMTPIGQTETYYLQVDDGICKSAVEIVTVNNKCDYGDLPDATVGRTVDPYPTLLADNGPVHVSDDNLLIGATLDGEADGQPSADAGAGANSGDDNTTGSDDEDGIASFPTLTAGTFVQIPVTIIDNTGASPTLYGWIDFNNDGVLDNTTERTSVAISGSGTAFLNFNIPAGAVTGTDLGLRVRLSTDAAAANPTGVASDGEVEDYLVQVQAGVVCTVSANPSANSPCVGGTLQLTANPSGGTNYTYNWEKQGGGFTSSLENPSISNAQLSDGGTYNLTVTDLGVGATCTAVVSVNAVVNALPSVTCPSNQTVCEEDLPLNLTALTGYSPTGGVFSGTGVSLNGTDYEFTGSAGTTTTITYTVEDVNGCESSCTFDVTIPNPAPPTCPSNQTVCEEDLPLNLTALTGYSPTGGVFSGTGVSLNGTDYEFTGSAGTTTTITYTVEDVNGCESSCTFDVTIPNPAPPTCPSNQTVCEEDLPLNLTALTGYSPTGGVFSGTGVSLNGGTGNYEFTGSAGTTTTITYTVEDVNGCESSCTFDVTIPNPAPPTCPSNQTVCEEDLPLNLTALTGYSPTGGVFSGTGVSLNGTDYEFTGSAGTTTTITYTVEDVNGCESSCTFDVTIPNPAPPTCPSNQTVCEEDLPLNLTALTGYSPTGGVFSGTGVSLNGTDYEFTGSAGTTTTITYTVEDVNGCESSCTFDVTIPNPAPPTCPSNQTVCEEDLPLNLTALTGYSPTGGVFSGTGVSLNGTDYEFTGTAGTTTTITYTVEDVNGCESSCTFDVTIPNPAPPTCPSNQTVCEEDLPLNLTALTGYSPTGGVFSGTGVSLNGTDYEFTGTAGTTTTITYTVEDVNGCESSCTFMVTINCDYGDLPDNPYPTLSASDGPRHAIDNNILIGSLVDADADGQQSPQADGDDNDGTDDEDGVTFPTLTAGASADVTVNVTNTTGSAATLYGWIDFDNDGILDNATERVSVAVPDGTTAGNVTLNFSVPSGAETGTNLGARFRLSTDAAAANPTGFAADGEVEDYVVQIEPTCPTITVVTPSADPICTGEVFDVAVTHSADPGADIEVYYSTTQQTTAADVYALPAGNLLGSATPGSGATSTTITGVSIPLTGINGTVYLYARIATGGSSPYVQGACEPFVEGTVTVDVTPPTITCPTDITIDANAANCSADVTVPLPLINDNCAANGLDFDGQNDRVVLGSLGPFYQSAFTIEGWIRSSDNNGAAVFNANQATNLNNAGIVIEEHNVQQIRFLYRSNPSNTGGFQLVSSTQVFDGTWHHFAAVRDGSNTALYIDGVLEASNTGSASDFTQALSGFLSFNAPGSARFFDGQMDDVRVWDDARTATEIMNNMNAQLNGNEAGLVAYYSMNQGFACQDNTGLTTLEDETSNNFDGTLENFDLTGSGGDPCESNWTTGAPALSLSLTNDYNNSTNASDNYPEGSTAVTWTVTDAAGNTAECTMNVTVNCYDWGDLPDDGDNGQGAGEYYTLLANDGPRHAIDPDIFIGSTVDTETDGQQSTLANGDDNDGADDEDGVTFPTLVAGTSADITVSVTNNTNLTAQLYGWIDFNNDGILNNTTEVASATVGGPTGGATNVTLTFNVPADAVIGPNLGARFRLSTDAAAANPTGLASDGEVEDYVVQVVCPTLMPTVSNIQCDNNNTTTDADDFLTFDINVSTSATASVSGYTLSGAVIDYSGVSPMPASGNVLSYGTNYTGFALSAGTAGGGNVNLTITDEDNNSCTETAVVADPGPCSAAQADLSLIKTVDDASPNVGQAVEFTIQVTNSGPNAASGVSVEDVVPAGYDATTITPTGAFAGDASVSGNVITWTGLSVPYTGTPQSIQLTFTVEVEAPTGTAGEYENIAQITASDQFDPDSDPNSGLDPDGDGLIGNQDNNPNDGSVDPDPLSEDDEDNEPVTPQQADLSLIKTVSDGTPNVGDEVTFTIEVTNSSSDAATGVEVTDDVPNGYSGINMITTSSGTGSGSATGSTITWINQTVPANGSITLTFKVTVEAPGTGVDYDNVAQVTASDQFDPDSDPNSGLDPDGDGLIGNQDNNPNDGSVDPDPGDEDDEDNEPVTPQQADLSLIKTVSDGTPNVGDEVTFTIEVTNSSSDAATGVEVTDDVPNGYSGINMITTSSGTGSGSATGSTITWINQTVPANGSITLTFKVTVEAPGTGVDYDNVAQVTASDQFDPDSDPNSGLDPDGDGLIGNQDNNPNDGSVDPDPLSEDDEDNEPVTPQQADLSLIKTVDDASPNVGQAVEFTIEVTNSGPNAASGVSVEDVVPAGYDATTITPTGAFAGDASVSGNVITWTGLSVPYTGTPQSIQLTFTVEVEAPTGTAGEYENIAQITASDQFDPDSDPNSGLDPDGDGLIGNQDNNPNDGSVDPDPLSEDDEDNEPVTPNASVGDFVWNDLNANGTQDVGEPGINGVTVSLTDDLGNPVTDADGNAVPSTTTTTNGGQDGYYEFTNLVPGDYIVVFSTPTGFNPTGEGAGVDDDVADDSDANETTGQTDVFSLSSGETEPDLDAGYYAPATVGDFVWNDLNANGTQDVGEPGINGVTVSLTDDLGNPVTDADGNAVPSTTTMTNGGQDGYYEFTNLVPGDYIVVFSTPTGFNPTGEGAGVDDDVPNDSDADETTGQTDVFSLSSGENEPDLDAGYYAPASVGDFVWNDLNGDGIQDPSEPGINGVTVSLTDNLGNAVTDADGNPVNPTTTMTNGGQDGFYEFTNLVPGDYIVVFTTPTGFNPTGEGAGVDDDVPNDSDADETTGQTDVFSLSSGENEPDLDAGYYAPASVGDFVWNDLNGDGIQDPSEPGINGVTVSLTDNLGNAVTDADGNPVNPTTTMTNGGQDGFYEFTNLVPGDYIVVFTTPTGFNPTGEGAGVDDDVPNDSDADETTGQTDVFSLSSGENEPDLDAGYYAPASVGDFVWNDLNGDGIQDPSEPGINGVTVSLTDNLGNAVTDADGNPVNPTTTMTNGGQDGFYEFTNLVPGDYIVVFTTPTGFNPTGEGAGVDDDVPNDSDADETTGQTDVFSLSSGENEPDLDAGYYAPASVGDFVWNDLNGDGIQDPSEPGINGVTVSLTDNLGNAVTDADGNLVPSTTTMTNGGQDGYYEFTNLVPGDYIVVFTTPTGFNPTGEGAGVDDDVADDSDANETTGQTDVFSLSSGETEPDLDAGYYAPATVGDFVWNDLNANGTQDVGEPGINGVTVSLTDNLGNPVTDADGNAVPSTTTMTNGGQDGYYEFTNLVPGDYKVVFTTPTGYFPTTEGAANDEDDGTDSDADETNGETNVFTLASGDEENDIDAGYYLPMSLGSYVWYDVNGNGQQGNATSEPPVEGAILELFFANGDPAIDANGNTVSSQTTGSDGLYHFTNLVPGEYYVVMTPPVTGYDPTNGGTDDPDNDPNDNDNNGSLIGTDIQSQNITLVNNDEPDNSVETEAGNTQDDAAELNGNQTLDFGLIGYNLGNRVWLDADNSGTFNAGDTGQDGVEVALYEGDGVTPVFVGDDGILGTGDDGTDNTVTTAGGGYFLFRNLPAGDYIVEVVRSSLADDSWASSTRDGGDPDGALDPDGAVNGDDPDIDVEDSDDNGIDNLLADVRSAAVTLGGTEPIGETDLSGGQGGPDDRSNMTVDFSFVPLDFGDLPDSYATDKADTGEGEGPSHIVITNLRIGTLDDSDPDGAPTSDALGDDLGDGSNDEDGVTFPLLIAGQTAIIEVDAVNFTGGDATLYAFFDWNNDGVFDAGEVITATVPDLSSSINLSVPVPANAVLDTETGARFRLTTEDLAARAGGYELWEGPAQDGEVEDYLIEVTGLSVGSTVFEDTNNNGVQDSGEPGIPNVDVELLLDADNSGAIDPGETTAVQTVQTNAQGNYIFEGLVEGNYAVRIPASNFSGALAGTAVSSTDIATTPGDNNVDGDDNGQQTGGAGTVVQTDVFNLTSGAEPVDGAGATDENQQGAALDNAADANGNMTIDFGFYAPVDVGDFVWADLDENGLQDAGEPGVPGITVRLFDADNDAQVTTDVFGNALPLEVTDANGAYLFENVPAGNYYVVFDLGTVPNYYAVTTQDVDGNVSDDADSDANPVSGRSSNTGVIPSGGSDLSLDMGLICIIEVQAGDPAKVCGQSLLPLTQLDASITPAGLNATWSSSGDGQFVQMDETTPDNSFDGAVYYIPGPNDRQGGSVTLTLTSEAAGPCGEVSDTVTITILKVDCGTFPWDGN